MPDDVAPGSSPGQAPGSGPGQAHALLLEAALFLASRHWPVFPCHTPQFHSGRLLGCSCRDPRCDKIGKHPRTRHGFKDATYDPATIARWWRQWPEANLALATGLVSGTVWIDIDSYSGGEESLAALARAHTPLPTTLEQLTGGGGRQLAFAHPGAGVYLPDSTAKLGPGLDVRGDGGYVIVPPSLHASSRRYAWEITHHLDDTPLAPLPDWLRALIQTTRRAPVDAAAPIYEHTRETTLFQLGCSMRARGFTQTAITAALMEINATQCVPPLDEAEVRQKAAQAAHYPTGRRRLGGSPQDNGQRPPTDTDTTPGDAADDASADAPDTPDTRPVIDVTTRMTEVTDQMSLAIQHLKEAPVLFQRTHRLVHIARGVSPPAWLDRALDAPVIVPATPAYVRELASQAAQWVKYDKRSKRHEPTLPPPWVVETLFGRDAWDVPPLTGIVHAPTMRPDGEVVTTEGYDRATGLYLDYQGVTFPPLPQHPTLDDARTALGVLQEAVSDFPWERPHGFAATCAAVLSLACRYAIQGAVPLFPVRSTVRGSGKGLLVDVIATIATGRHAPKWTQALSDEEDEKRLITIGLAGDPCAHIDNVNHPLGSGPLDAAITGPPTFTGRVLGTQTEVTVPWFVVLFASGNNMAFKGDMIRRVVPIDLDPRMEHPEERENFTHPRLLEWVRTQRPRLYVAALTILLSHTAAGRPAQALKPMGSFEPWGDVIRDALVWAGEPDPCTGLSQIEAESDVSFAPLATLLEAWQACYRDQAVTLNQAVQDMQLRHVASPDANNPPNQWNDLLDAMVAYDSRFDGKRLDTRRLGEGVRQAAGRVIDRRRFVRAGTYNRAVKWRIETL